MGPRRGKVVNIYMGKGSETQRLSGYLFGRFLASQGSNDAEVAYQSARQSEAPSDGFLFPNTT